MTTAANVAGAPWYREPWPWILMAGPAAVVVAGAVTMFLAFHGTDALVSPDYYTRGLAINRDLARERHALQAGISAQLEWSAASGRLVVRTRGGAAEDFPAMLRLRLMHPVRPELDRSLDAVRSPDGTYTAQAGSLDRHRWKLTLECAQWRLSGEWKDPAEPAAIAPGDGT